MANRTGKKGKKPLQTTLGKASVQNEKEPDLSHVGKPIHTSIFGLRQVLSLFQTATEEVQDYITYECDIMYECRTCRTIFRSLGNFILHKRNYCRERFRHMDILNINEMDQEAQSRETTLDNDSRSRPVSPVFKDTKRDLAPVIEKLKERQEIHNLAQECLNKDLSINEPIDISNKPCNLVNKGEHSNDVLLETIATNNAAVFQTMLRNLPPTEKTEYMKSEVMEIHGILDSDEAVLGPDGKICTFNTNKVNQSPIIPKNKFFCPKCNLKFSTKKTLTYHIKYKHNNSRLLYVCPDCKDTFANAWCVYRHLFKIHRKTAIQIKKMRDQIHSSFVSRDYESTKKKDKNIMEKLDKTDEEDQWLSNIEGDNYFQMCGGCGKRFERKAALHSHAQMCTKRIAVCNTIKENNAKKKEEGKDKNKILITEKNRPSEVLKGSLKRKPYLLRTYKPTEKQVTVKQEINSSDEICDVNANCELLGSNCDNKNEVKNYNVNKVMSPTIAEVLSSPSIKNACASPSVDTMDTERMLNIIGISSISENASAKNSNLEPCSIEKLPENKSTVDFDEFCQNIAEQMEKDNALKKSSKTVPLILRRRNPPRHEKGNNNSIKKCSESLDIKQQTDIVEVGSDEPDLRCSNETCELLDVPSTSSFRISVKRFEDLKGSSMNDLREECDILKTESNENITNTLNIPPNINVVPNVSNILEVSDTIRANVSPKQLQHKVHKPLKRKLATSFDCMQLRNLKHGAKNIANIDDVSFISKASPYMDQDKLLCVPCQLSYPTLPKLLWHMSAHFSWFRFQCSRCSFISFNKFDCASHARRSHNVKRRSMYSIVLPIPNWKTVLMAHEFCPLTDEIDLSGKHTDEVISGDQEEIVLESAIGNTKKDEFEEDLDNNIFDDVNCLDSESENCDYLNCPSIKRENVSEGIDIVDDTSDSHQIEIPQEIYTLDVSEIMNSMDDRQEERVRLMARIKIEKFDYEDENEESYFLPAKNKPKIETKIKSEANSDDEISRNLPMCKNTGTSKVTTLKKSPDTSVNIRPTRNRMRSIKTLQDDFFYDLGKLMKLNDNSVSKSSLQKQKKNNQNDSQKPAKGSISSCSKNEKANSMRVYSKKK